MFHYLNTTMQDENIISAYKIKTMISTQTLDAVNNGIVTDEELKEALLHYRTLFNLLSCHDDKYKLVYFDVGSKLRMLEEFDKARKSK